MQNKLRAQALQDLVQKFNPRAHREDAAILFEITGFQEGLSRRAAGLKAALSDDAVTIKSRSGALEQPGPTDVRGAQVLPLETDRDHNDKGLLEPPGPQSLVTTERNHLDKREETEDDFWDDYDSYMINSEPVKQGYDSKAI